MMLLVSNAASVIQGAIARGSEVSELKTIIYLLGGGMAAYILKMVFDFLKWILGKGNGHKNEARVVVEKCAFQPFKDSNEYKEFSQDVRLSHGFAQASLNRIEVCASKENDSMIRMTTILEEISKKNDRQINLLEMLVKK